LTEERTPTALTVIVVDDHPIFREALALMLRDAGYAVTEAATGEDAVELAISERPQFVVMDVQLPGLSGIDATRQITSQTPGIWVLILSTTDSAETVRAAVKAGAASYLTKSATSRPSLLDALRRTAMGERIFVPPRLIDALAQEPAQPSDPISSDLTLREREIVALVAQGTANADIASTLGLSPRTVESHLRRIYRKLKVGSRTQLARVTGGRAAGLYPFSGEDCTVIMTDITAFGSPARSDSERMALRESLFEVLRDSLIRSGVPWTACYVEDRGDGVLIVAPPGIPTASLVNPFIHTFASSVAEHNKIAPAPLRMQIRLAIDVGPVLTDTIGVSGRAIIQAARLVDSPAIRIAIGPTDHPLGVIVSEVVYETTIGKRDSDIEPEKLERVKISVKETTTTGWIWLVKGAG
jgi:DNA-binding NarL/FixJ family response regulator